MTLIVKAAGLAKEWNGQPLFEGVDLEIRQGERIALFGRNGVGKSTLLQMLTGRMSPDAGMVERRLPLSEWGWIDQQAEVHLDMTTIAYVQSGNQALDEIRLKLAKLQRDMEFAADMAKNDTESCGGVFKQWTASLDMDDVLASYGECQEKYSLMGGYDWEIDVERKLRQMNLGPEVWNIPFTQLSGGQKTRAQLARLMTMKPKFLLLDEPTNHLDADMLAWLEQWMVSYSGTILFVSHDRAFLDAVADCIYEITPNGSKLYSGGYTAYLEQKELERRTQETLYRKQELARKELEECIRNYQQWFMQAHRAAAKVEAPITKGYYNARATKNATRFKAKQRELERLEAQRVKTPRDAEQLRMNLGEGQFAARTIMRGDSLSFGFGSRALINELTFTLERGDRLAVLGPNGAGKTTLLKLLLGELQPDSGTVQLHPQAKIGRFSQELQGLDDDMTLLDSLLSLPSMTQSFARTVLGCFLFSREDVFKRIGDLSMGEKCRAAFLKLYFSGANLLVLDEPTNYFDVDTRERVEQALQHYPGALVIVSHDRYLIRKVASRLLMLDGPSTHKLFPGTLAELESGKKERQTASIDAELAGELQLLELQVAQWMSADAPTPEAKEEHVRLIQAARIRISDLRQTLQLS